MACDFPCIPRVFRTWILSQGRRKVAKPFFNSKQLLGDFKAPLPENLPPPQLQEAAQKLHRPRILAELCPNRYSLEDNSGPLPLPVPLTQTWSWMQVFVQTVGQQKEEYLDLSFEFASRFHIPSYTHPRHQELLTRTFHCCFLLFHWIKTFGDTPKASIVWGHSCFNHTGTLRVMFTQKGCLVVSHLLLPKIIILFLWVKTFFCLILFKT